MMKNGGEDIAFCAATIGFDTAAKTDGSSASASAPVSGVLNLPVSGVSVASFPEPSSAVASHYGGLSGPLSQPHSIVLGPEAFAMYGIAPLVEYAQGFASCITNDYELRCKMIDSLKLVAAAKKSLLDTIEFVTAEQEAKTAELFEALAAEKDLLTRGKI